jgi:hypothetical protein
MTKPKFKIDFQNKQISLEGSEKVEIPLKDRPQTEPPNDLEAILTPSDLDKLAKIKGAVEVEIK